MSELLIIAGVIISAGITIGGIVLIIAIFISKSFNKT
jgi:hypothetical protein